MGGGAGGAGACGWWVRGALAGGPNGHAGVSAALRKVRYAQSLPASTAMSPAAQQGQQQEKQKVPKPPAAEWAVGQGRGGEGWCVGNAVSQGGSWAMGLKGGGGGVQAAAPPILCVGGASWLLTRGAAVAKVLRWVKRRRGFGVSMCCRNKTHGSPRKAGWRLEKVPGKHARCASSRGLAAAGPRQSPWPFFFGGKNGALRATFKSTK
jgi:hypothetical protein